MPPLGTPATLNRQQYRGTAAGKKKGASYSKYLAYIAKNRPGRVQATQDRLAAANDPLRPLTEPQIQQRARTDIRSQVDPLIAEITRGISARTKAGMGAIGGYTNQLAGQLEPYAGKAAGIYGNAQASQAGTDAALAQMLSGQGDDLAAGLAAKLGAAGLGQPVIDKTTGQVQQTGTGAAGALYGSGSAGMTDLIAQGAGAQDYAAKLPGIARLGGLQQAGAFRQQQAHDLNTQTGEIRAQVPGAVTSAITKYRGEELDKGLARSANETKQVEAVYGAQAAAAKAAAKAAVDADKAAQAWTKIRQAGDRLTLQGSNTSFNQSVKAAGLDLDQKQYKLAMAKEARLKRTAGSKAKGGGFTAAKKQDMAEIAVATARDDLYGGVDDKGNKFEARRPVETLRDLIASGIPFSIAIKAIQRFGKSADAPPEWKATLGWTH